MMEHTSFSNPNWVDQKGNSRIVPANINTFEAVWTCIPYLQLSESIRNFLITLLEQETLKLKKNPWWRCQMSHILPHRWFKMRYRSLAACHCPLPIPMPSQSKVKQYQDHEVDFSHLSDKSFEVFGKRPFRWHPNIPPNISIIPKRLGRDYFSGDLTSFRDGCVTINKPCEVHGRVNVGDRRG